MIMSWGAALVVEAAVRLLHGHEIETAYERGWSTLAHGELIAQAEAAGFHVLLTTDRKLRHQRNLCERRLALVVLSTAQLSRFARPRR